MKKIVVLLFIPLFLSGFNGNGSYSRQPDKFALIVAISEYPRESGWSALSSYNDIALIKESLINQGFTEDYIQVITDSDASKAGIQNALETLIERVQNGDVVVFHFSGHGQQIQDDDGDEVDGYDESLVPFGARMYYKKGVYTGQDHFRDDLLQEYLGLLRKKAGSSGHILVTLDACHSGTATRGLSKHRGTSVAMEEPGYAPRRRTGNQSGFYEGSTDKNLGSMVVISASSDQEINYEYADANTNFSCGSLSYALSKTMLKTADNASYNSFFHDIKNQMATLAPRQSPQMEGDADHEILGGRAMKQENYFTVKGWVDDRTVRINGGKVMGLSNNSTVGFYPAGTSKPSDKPAIASGTVSNSGMLECDVVLDKPLTEQEARNCWVFIRDIFFENYFVRVKLNLIDSSLKTLIGNGIAAYPVIEIVGTDEDLLIEEDQANGKGLTITTRQDQVIYSTSESDRNERIEEIIDNAVNKILSFSQVNFLKNIEMVNEALDVDFDIIKINPQQAGASTGNQLILKNGDQVKIRIINRGFSTVYFNLLDIQPDNQLNILIPPHHYNKLILTPEECKINAGDTIIFPHPFRICPPFGNEIFKFIVSGAPFNLEPIATTRGTKNSMGTQNPFSILFSNSFLSGRKRGGGNNIQPVSEVTIRTLVFKIVP